MLKPSRAGSARAKPTQIRVYVRFRPPRTEGSGSSGGGSCSGSAPTCVEYMDGRNVKIRGVTAPFTFDRVFGGAATQAEIFAEAAQSTVEGVLQGYNGCVLAYGQTGAGKSHTMMGPRVLGEQRGLIPRMVEHLFARKPSSHAVRVAYMEIYNEKVRDLLGEGTDLKVHETAGGGGFHVRGLTEIEIRNGAAEVYAIMQRGDRQRSTAATQMNAASSRSHSVFLVELAGPATRSKLVLVDLAGSEKVAKTGARGAVLEEAANINRSLTSLGMVVNALAQASEEPGSGSASAASAGANSANANASGAAAAATAAAPSSSSSSAADSPGTSDVPHVPFRDSKLTRILQDSLAGNSRTCLIVHCSPEETHASETVSTLRFGLRAKHVKTVPKIAFAPPPPPQQQQLVQHQQLQAQFQALQQQYQLLVESGTAEDGALAHLHELNQQLRTENSRLSEQVCFTAQRVELLASFADELRARIAEIELQCASDRDVLNELSALERRVSEVTSDRMSDERRAIE